ncbi:hypothetical protein DSCW_18440 [Desulfosarcina widdelii]|uniref:Host-nuclease inhibitor protein Gam n=1 Tax=Desulfosarcina widdelii TaxID=947919 RepID=A0A5K7ZDU5_9BACT|nr:host-nuclease inhibitor Gam family protein [Desulfosarcina widdelii]BBO74427.1 hypothetical protein DSCW_18440 [Desulfosarcina widdelii]
MSKSKEDKAAIANALLEDISRAIAARDAAAKRAAKKIEAVKKKYGADIEREKKVLSSLENRLERVVKAYRFDILGAGERADLAAGSVMIKDETRVKRIKGMLEKLKAAGMKQAIRIAKETVDWDRVEQFNDAALARLGTERVKKALFSYELKNS